MELIDSPDGLPVRTRWKGLPNSEDSLVPIESVYEDVPQMLLRLLDRKNVQPALAAKIRSVVSL